MATDRSRVQHLDHFDRAAGDVTGQPGPDRLDFRELRHYSSCGFSLSGLSSCGLSPLGDAYWSMSAAKAASAARCSASFLVLPVTPPWRSPATTAQAVNVFAWSGPVWSMW